MLVRSLQYESLSESLAKWMFADATKYLDGQPEDVLLVVNALASAHGNCGWVGGDVGVLIEAALMTITCEQQCG